MTEEVKLHKRMPKIPNGSGERLGELQYFSAIISKYKENDDVIRAMHSLCFNSVGCRLFRRKALALFRGFDSSVQPHDISSRLTDNRKKWNIQLLKEACELLGLEKTGSRFVLCDRIAEYVYSPYETKSSDDVPAKIIKTNTKRMNDKKRKADALSGESTTQNSQPRKKRYATAFMIFSREMRPRVRAEHPDATFGGLGKILGELWNNQSDADKLKWKEKATALKNASIQGSVA